MDDPERKPIDSPNSRDQQSSAPSSSPSARPGRPDGLRRGALSLLAPFLGAIALLVAVSLAGRDVPVVGLLAARPTPDRPPTPTPYSSRAFATRVPVAASVPLPSMATARVGHTATALKD